MTTATRKSLKLKTCPRCGGDVCRMRDTFGFYHQCAQCGREIRQLANHGMPAPDAGPTAIGVTPDTTEQMEKLIV